MRGCPRSCGPNISTAGSTICSQACARTTRSTRWPFPSLGSKHQFDVYPEHEEVHRTGWHGLHDPVLRMADMDREGVTAELDLPRRLPPRGPVPQRDQQAILLEAWEAGAQAWNRWTADAFGFALDRFLCDGRHRTVCRHGPYGEGAGVGRRPRLHWHLRPRVPAPRGDAAAFRPLLESLLGEVRGAQPGCHRARRFRDPARCGVPRGGTDLQRRGEGCELH